MRSLAFLSVGRSDFGRYLPVLKALAAYPDVATRLLVSGGHYAHISGQTLAEIEAAGVPYVKGLEMSLDADTPSAVGKSVGVGTLSLAQALANETPDMLVILGDRFEMLAGAIAAMGHGIPVAHLHGGAVTEGAMDDMVRHALTKMSHLHMVVCAQYAERVRQLGEEPWRVFDTGAPILDSIHTLADMTLPAISEALGFDFAKPTLLVTYHPVTLERSSAARDTAAFVEAIEGRPEQLVITYPNVDIGNRDIVAAIEALRTRHPARIRVIRNAGTQLYCSMLRHCRAVVGNSSSGIVEAASFATPAVNVGTRQKGKMRPQNVIDCGESADDIRAAIAQAVSDEFRAGLQGMANPYGDGNSGSRIAEILATIPIDDKLRRKRFVDLPVLALP